MSIERLVFDARELPRRPSSARARLLGLVPALVATNAVGVTVIYGDELSPTELECVRCADLVPLPPRGRAAAHTDARALFVTEALPGSPDCLRVVPHFEAVAGTDRRTRRRRRQLERGFATARAIVVPTRATATELARFWPQAAERVHVLPGGVRPELFHPREEPADADVLARRGLTRGDYVLSVGKLEEVRAPEVAVRVREAMAKRSVDRPLVMVGQGPVLPEEAFTWLRADYPKQRLGVVLRDVTTEELPALLRGAGVVLATAPGYTSGLALVEAMACGAPIVASDTPVHREILRDDGFRVRARDPDLFTSYVLAAIEGRMTFERRTEAAARCHRERSWNEVALRLLEILEIKSPG